MMPIADRARGGFLAHWLTLDTHERTMLLRLLHPLTNTEPLKFTSVC